MIVIDSGEPELVSDAFDRRGIPYIRAEIKFYSCKNCKKVGIKPFECCGEIESERAGDFTNTKRTFLVERKTPGDFVGSMLDKSLQSQAARIAKYFSGWKFVFLEGFISVMIDNPYNKKIKSWIRSMRVYLRQFDICMWQMDDIGTMIRELVRLDENCGKTPMIYDKVNDKYTGWTDAKKIVCKLADVSGKKADRLLEYIGSPWDIFSAIIHSEIIYTRTGNPKGITGPLSGLKGFGYKFISKNKKMLLNEKN